VIHHSDRYLSAVVERTIADLRSCEGSRNVALNNAAFGLGQRLHWGLSEDAVRGELVTAGMDLGLPSRVVQYTVRRSLREGRRKPRPIPSRRAGSIPGRHVTSRPPVRSVDTEDLPPSSEVASLWDRCVPVDVDQGVSGWLRGRGLDPGRVADRDLARALPDSLGGLPAWAGFTRAGAWNRNGYRCLLPLYDDRAVLHGLRARRIVDVAPDDWRASIKETATKCSGLVFADPLGRLLLDQGELPDWWGDRQPLTVVVVEGGPDFLTWATHYSDADADAPGILGVFSGAWSDRLAQRLPAGIRWIVATHSDPAGDKFAERIRASVSGRALIVLRRRL